jgi:hypothetical protein
MSVNTAKDIKKIVLRIDEASGDPEKRFEAAKAAAVRAAGKDAFMLAWRDQINGHFSPCTGRCERDETEAWEVYGGAHEADLRVDVDSGRYSFLFRTR